MMDEEERTELMRLRHMMQTYSEHHVRLMHAMEKDNIKYKQDMSSMILAIDRMNHRVGELERVVEHLRRRT